MSTTRIKVAAPDHLYALNNFSDTCLNKANSNIGRPGFNGMDTPNIIIRNPHGRYS